MSWLIKILNSSIGKKLIMSLAGLFLVIFLLVHLGINLTLLRHDNGEWFKAASGFMGSNYIIKVFEVVLMLGFLLHIVYGIILQIQNWMARPVRYKIENLTSQTSFFSKFMIHTGIIIFVFLIIHFVNFYFVKYGILGVPAGAEGKHDFYNMALNLFHLKGYVIFYIAFMLFLGFHLNHAFQSAFQTLGFNNNKYSCALKIAGTVYSVIIGFGFALIPFLIYFFY